MNQMPSFSLFPSSHVLIYKKYSIHEKKITKMQENKQIYHHSVLAQGQIERSTKDQKRESSVHKQQRVK